MLETACLFYVCYPCYILNWCYQLHCTLVVLLANFECSGQMFRSYGNVCTHVVSSWWYWSNTLMHGIAKEGDVIVQKTVETIVTIFTCRFVHCMFKVACCERVYPFVPMQHHIGSKWRASNGWIVGHEYRNTHWPPRRNGQDERVNDCISVSTFPH